MNFMKNLPYQKFDNPQVHEDLKQLAIQWATYNHPLARQAIIYAMTLYMQSLRGTQLVVSRELSDELAQTDLQNFTADDLVIMWPSMEIYFEDPALPTIAWFVKDKEYADSCTKYLGMPYELACEDHFGFEWYDTLGTGYTCQLGRSLLNAWMAGGDIPTMKGMIPNDPEEAALQKKLFMLLAKLFIYCSLPQYRPQAVSRKQLHHGGKAGVHNRPKRPVYIVTVPAVKYQPKARVSASSGKEVVPHRRRGYLRKLVSERFLPNKRGTFVHVRPCMVHGGTVSDHIYLAVTKGKNEATAPIKSGEQGSPTQTPTH